MAASETAPTALIGMLPRLRRYARVLTTDVDAADDLVAATLGSAATLRASQRSSIVSLMAVMHHLHRRGTLGRGGRARPAAARAVAATGRGLVDLLLELPLEHREILLLVAVERLAYDEVATLLDVPAATVIGRLSRARANLRALTESLERRREGWARPPGAASGATADPPWDAGRIRGTAEPPAS